MAKEVDEVRVRIVVSFGQTTVFTVPVGLPLALLLSGIWPTPEIKISYW